MVAGMGGGKRSGRRLAAFAGGLGLALVLLAPAARADRIDGEWCHDDGRFMSMGRAW